MTGDLSAVPPEDSESPAVVDPSDRTPEVDQRVSSSLGAIVDLLSEGILAHDGARVTFVNAAALRMLGYGSAGELLGTEVLDLVHPDDRALVRERVARVISHETTELIERRFLRKDRSIAYVEVFGRGIPSEGGPLVLVAFRDVTKWRRSEETLALLLLEAERKNRELESFVYSVSHELKTPLAVIRGASEILADDVQFPNETEAGPLVEAIAKSSQRMEATLETLLELSRIGLVSYPDELVLVEDLVQTALEIVGQQLESRGIRVCRQFPPVRVYVDRLRMIEVFVNLLTNAAKYGGDPVKPEIGICASSDGGWVTVTVNDNGPPIPYESIATIFEPFRRGSNVGGAEGSGLGLFIARRIVESHQGEIRVRSSAEGGNDFEIRLPLENPDTGRIPEEVRRGGQDRE